VVYSQTIKEMKRAFIMGMYPWILLNSDRFLLPLPSDPFQTEQAFPSSAGLHTFSDWPGLLIFTSGYGQGNILWLGGGHSVWRQKN